MKAYTVHQFIEAMIAMFPFNNLRKSFDYKGMKRLSVILAFVLMALTPFDAPAQTLRLPKFVAVHGLVQTRERGALSGAQITFENDQTHVRVFSTSGSRGEFEISRLKPGLYSVTIEARGYALLRKSAIFSNGGLAGLNLRAQLWPNSATDGSGSAGVPGEMVVRPANPMELIRAETANAHSTSRVAAVKPAATSSVNSAADFSLYSQVIAPNPQPFGLNVSLTGGSNLTDNVLLADGGFGPFDARLPLSATDDGSATTFISTDATGAGTDDYSSITSGYFVGATAKVFRFQNNAWSLVRTDTVTGYTAVAGSNAPSDHTVTFAEAGPATMAGDVIWLEFDAVPQVPSPLDYNTRLGDICLNWNNIQTGCWQQNGPAPYTLDSTAPSDDTGGLSLKVTDSKAESTGISQYLYIGIDTYESFQANHTYRADVWLKQAPGGDGTATFSLGNIGVTHTFTGVNSTWQHFTWDFPAPTSVPSTYSEPQVSLSFNAPGTMWINRFQVYDTSFAPFSLNPIAQQALTDYHPGTIRIWSGFNNGGNYAFMGLDEWIAPEIHSHTDPLLGNQYEGAPNTELLPNALKNAKTLGANPWLIVNMSYDENEIAHLIEYLEAPAGVGYAAMRPSDHPGPYTDDFSAIYLEVGNEEWGTQQTPVNFAYGQWAQYLIDSAKNLAGFDPSTSKIQFIVNGFFLQPSFGSAAIAQAPDAKWVDYAIYSGGDSSLSGDPYYQSDLLTLVSSNKSLIDNMVAQQQVDALGGHPYSIAAYESGPGQDTPTHQGDSSLAAGVGTLDVELYAALRGFGPENYFDFRLGPGPYTSNSEYKYGLLPHPALLAFQMRNTYCHGPMTWTIPNSVPVTNDSNQYPLIGVYTFHDTTDGKNDAEVVVISRDLNNTTPVTLHLPFTPTGSGTLYTLTGDPRGNNDTALSIPIANQSLSGITADYTFNMPPGSVYILDIPAAGDWKNTTPPPATPTDLQAVADNGKVSLLWGSVDGVANYNLKRSTTKGGPYTTIAQPTGAGYTDTGLTNGTTYYYVVSAMNNGGESANSNEVAVTPNVDDTGYTSTPPSIDGSDSGPWNGVQAQPLTHDFNTYTPDTATFKTLWDRNYLYMLVSVQDATPTISDTVYYGDSVELYFSGTDSKASSYGPTDFQFEFPYGGTTVSEYGHGATAGVKFGQIKITGGYQMTVAIPWTTLGTQPVVGKQYGFDVMINDGTSNDVRAGKLAWWGTEDLTYANPSLMGPLVLTQNGNYLPTDTSLTVNPSSGLVAGQPWTLTATVKPVSGSKIPAGSVAFTADGPYGKRSFVTLDATGKAVLDWTAPGAGAYNVTAEYVGSNNFEPSSSTSIPVEVSGMPTSVTTTLTAGSNVVYGQPWKIQVQVTSSGGTVAGGFVNISYGLHTARLPIDSNGTATFGGDALTLGSFSIQASYGGSEFFASSSAPAVPISVTPCPTTTTVAVSPAAGLAAGAPYVLTATVTPKYGRPISQGTVTFTAAGPQTLSARVGVSNGLATLTGPAPSDGVYSVTAASGLSANYLNSTSAPVTVQITGAAVPTQVTIAQSPSTGLVTGQPWTLTAVVSPKSGSVVPQGTVTFYWGTGTATATVDPTGKAVYQGTLPLPGSYSVYASYNGSALFGLSDSQRINFTVAGYSTTTQLTAVPDGNVFTGQPIQLKAVVTPSSGSVVPTGNVVFSIGAVNQTVPLDGTGTANLSTTPTAVGTLTIKAAYQGSASFAASTSNTVTETVAAATSTQVQVSLASTANMAGIWTDGIPVSVGMDGQGNAYSANVLGTAVTISGVTYDFGTSNQNDVVNGANGGPTIPLPAGSFTSLNFLGTGVYGSQSGQVFTVNYTDGSSQQFTQSLSDWYSPQSFAGESIAIACPYRLLPSGAKDNRTFYVYGYSFALDKTKQVKSLTMPNNWNDFVLAATLVP